MEDVGPCSDGVLGRIVSLDLIGSHESIDLACAEVSNRVPVFPIIVFVRILGVRSFVPPPGHTLIKFFIISKYHTFSNHSTANQNSTSEDAGDHSVEPKTNVGFKTRTDWNLNATILC